MLCCGYACTTLFIVIAVLLARHCLTVLTLGRRCYNRKCRVVLTRRQEQGGVAMATIGPTSPWCGSIWNVVLSLETGKRGNHIFRPDDLE